MFVYLRHDPCHRQVGPSSRAQVLYLRARRLQHYEQGISKGYSHAQISSIAQDDTFFGEEKQIQVTLIEKTGSLRKLHYDTMKALQPGNLQLNNPEFTGSNFRPHATVQKHARLQKGDTVNFTHIALIDMFPNKDPYRRKVLKIV